MSSLPADFVKKLADPTDGSALSVDRREGLLRAEGGGVYPVLGGVPVLVADPAGWVAAHRDAVLASLAEVGAADADAVRLVDAFASQVRVDPAPFGDDWTGNEEDWAEPPGDSATFRAFLDEARRVHVHDVLAGLVGQGALEIGCGAGPLTRRLRSPSVADRSLRAVLRSGAPGVVADAETLPFADGAFDTIVAANLVDLLDAPGAFVDEAARVVRPGGRLVLSTPDPALGVVDGADDALEALLADAGWVIREVREGVPWIRSHGSRHHQVYFVRVIVAEKPPARRGRARH